MATNSPPKEKLLAHEKQLKRDIDESRREGREGESAGDAAARIAAKQRQSSRAFWAGAADKRPASSLVVAATIDRRQHRPGVSRTTRRNLYGSSRGDLHFICLYLAVVPRLSPPPPPPVRECATALAATHRNQQRAASANDTRARERTSLLFTFLHSRTGSILGGGGGGGNLKHRFEHTHTTKRAADDYFRAR